MGLATLQAGYKVNIQKSILFPQNKDEQIEIEIKRNNINYNSIKEQKLFRYKSNTCRIYIYLRNTYA